MDIQSKCKLSVASQLASAPIGKKFLLTNLKLKTLADVLTDSCNIKFSDKALFYSQAVKITQLEIKLMEVDSPPYATHTTTENKQYIKHQLSLRERGTP